MANSLVGPVCKWWFVHHARDSIVECGHCLDVDIIGPDSAEALDAGRVRRVETVWR